jgi:SAM-dependent methyltransferase
MVEQNQWDRLMNAYAAVEGDIRQRFLFPAIVRLVEEFGRGGDLLDYGAGPGEVPFLVRDLAGKIVLVDASARAREILAGRFGDRALVLTPEKFFASDQLFDLALFVLVLTTIDDDRGLAAILGRLRRSLKPKGRLIVATSHPCFTFRAISSVPYRSSGGEYRVAIEPGLEIVEYHRPLGAVMNLLGEAGLRVTRTEEIFDDPEFHRSRKEAPPRFAGELPVFLVLVCESGGE